MADQSREEIIVKYFSEGYTYDEIRQILSKNGFILSYRHLQRLISDLGLKRKNLVESLPEITAAIVVELQGSGSCLGYKSMWQRLKQKYGLTVYRETVLHLLRILDPEGVELRAKYKLHRRVYKVPGPNFAWHLDGYDKLKPFGFAVHGCVDGYSRKVIWFELGTTNNKPQVVTYFYLKAVKKLGCVPSLIRSDHGTENNVIENLQQAFRLNHQDELAGIYSFIKGKSTANQRIESSWGRMRRHCVEFWIKFFKEMQYHGHFSKSNKIELECLRFCFSHLISYDLNQTRIEWNRHAIRKQPGEVKYGKPNFLYYVPEASGAYDCGHKVDENLITNAFNMYSIKSVCYDPNFQKLVDTILPNEKVPTNIVEATTLYHKILKELQNYENSE